MSKLRSARIERGLKITDAAILAGTNAGNLSRIERGHQIPKMGLAIRLCSLYNLSLDEVFRKASGPPPTSQPAQASREATA